MSNYTKGEWEVRILNQPVIVAVRDEPLDIAKIEFVNNNAESLANARLIAAAPELLEACKLATKQDHHPNCKTVCWKSATKDRCDIGTNCDCFVGVCRKVIAEAEKTS